MQDHELRKLLLETCPVRPGQEERAWAALQERLVGNSSSTPAKPAWGFFPSWAGAAVAVAVLVAIPVVGDFLGVGRDSHGFATADSQSPGVYATSFYSAPARAQVVWLNGLEPASDKPTYLDPTTVVGEAPQAPHPAGDPNSL